MSLGGKDYVFQKSNGDAEWWRKNIFNLIEMVAS